MLMKQLSQLCLFPKEKIEVANLNSATYISTENMLQDKNGITFATTLPNAEYTQSFNAHDVLVSNIRPYFKKIWYATYSGGCSNDVLVFRATGNNDPMFLYYVLADDNFFNYATQTAKGTKMPRGDKVAIMQYKVPNFPIDTQHKIAAVLKSLDDKIELNNNINENLEQQAQAIFKSWFVDFEPFGGKMPDEWTESSIYSIANIIYGAPFKSQYFNVESRGLPIVRIRDLKSQTLTTYTTEMLPKGYLIQPGDIVVGMDGEFKPNVWGNKEAWLNQRVCVFSNKRAKGKSFLFHTIKPLLNLVEKTELATTVIHIGKEDFDRFRIVLPSENILKIFDDVTMPMYSTLVNNLQENRKLAELRDSLLPKLMSGEIDVSRVKI